LCMFGRMNFAVNQLGRTGPVALLRGAGGRGILLGSSAAVHTMLGRRAPGTLATWLPAVGGKLCRLSALQPARGCSSGAPRGFGKFSRGTGKPKAKPDAKAAEKGSKSASAEPTAQEAAKKSGGDASGSGGSGGFGSGNKKSSPGSIFPDGDNTRTLALLLGAAGTMAVLSTIGAGGTDKSKEITFVEFCNRLVESGEVEKVVVTNNSRANVYMKQDGSGESALKYHFSIGSVDVFERRLEEVQRQQNIDTFDFIAVQYKTEVSVLGELSRFIPVLLLGGFFLYMRRNMGNMPGMGGGGPGGGRNPFSMGKSTATLFNKEESIGVMFKDVAGLEEAKTEVQEFVHFLKNPGRYEELGAKIPKGGVLHGPPGTGKTLLAKAVAGESGVPFYSLSGADFMEMFVGVGPSRVRDLFKKARADAPCIIFIDEIDAIGRKRGGGGGVGGNDERENTLNQILVEMDGFNTSTGVVVLAGTNRLDVLDDALLRPGRFDRQIVIDNPDVRGRKDIFMVHLSPLRLGEREDFDEGEAAEAVESLGPEWSPKEFYARKLAVLTPGMSGADIKNVCNEAALHAARVDSDFVRLQNFEAAMGRVIGGVERKTRVLSAEEKRTVAFHEAGHAVTGWFLTNALPLLKVSIVPRGSQALGYAQYLPRDQNIYTEAQLYDQMCMTLGGRAAEEIVFGRITTGASDDLDKVTKLAYAQVKTFGMNDAVGARSYKDMAGDQKFYRPHSDQLGDTIDAEVRALSQKAYASTLALLKEKREMLDAVAELLIEKEVIGHEELTRLCGERAGQDAAYDYATLANAGRPLAETTEAAADVSEDEPVTGTGQPAAA